MTKKAIKYENIVKDLIERIRRGEFPTGDKLPGQFALAKEYDVSAITANRALDELKKLGFIERHQRSGSFISTKLRFIRRIIILTSHDSATPGLWLRYYWDELCRINEANGVSTIIMKKTDPEFRTMLQQEKFSTGVILAGFDDRFLVEWLENNAIPYLVLGLRAQNGRFNVTENRLDAGKKLFQRLYCDGIRNAVFIGNLDQPNHREALDGCRLGVSLHHDSNLYEINAEATTSASLLGQLKSLAPHPDAILIMGSGLPLQMFPPLSKLLNECRFGFFTETPDILNFKDLAYLAVYSQQQTAVLATAMLEEIASGQLHAATTKFVDVEIISPYKSNNSF